VRNGVRERRWTGVVVPRDPAAAGTLIAGKPAISPKVRNALAIAAASILGAVVLSVFVIAAVIEIQAGAAAYIIGEGHWSRARTDAVYALHRYSATGAAQDLAAARAALDIPLGDRRARLALDARPRDLDAAALGFRAGRNAEKDIPRLIRLYRYFGRAPYFAEAVAIWREAEPDLLRLVAIADELEGQFARSGKAPAAAAYRAELDAIAARLEPRERAFSQTLQAGSEWLRRMLLIGSAGMFALIAASIVVAYALTLRRIRLADMLFRAAFMQSTVGMVKLMPDGRVIALNDRLARMLDRPNEDVIGHRFDELLLADEEERRPLQVDWLRLEAPIQCRIVGRDGVVLPCRLTASPVVDGQRGTARVFVMVEDISEARRLSDSLAHQASHDSLTGLINRREIERRIEALLLDCATGSRRHTLCFLDLDQFKLVNDTSSHAAGDQLLRLVAATLPERLGPPHWVGRLGGDEFAVLLVDTPVERGVQLAERVNRTLADTSLLWEGRHFSLTCSIGLVEINAETPTVAWLLRAADTACYLAKEGGRNQVRVYAESDLEVARRHDEMSWANQARAAMAEGRLRIYAQRIDALRPSGMDEMQYEVLVRMVDASGNLCPPAKFLGAIERFGQAAAIDAAVLRMTLDVLAEHPEHLRKLGLCHINVSGQSIASAAFRELVIAQLDTSPVPAGKLCFELTETASMATLAEAQAFIQAVRSRGCRVALDDFGSGLSSFAYLKSLDVDIVKIDGMFVRDIATDPLDLAVVRAVTEVTRTLGKTTIAEWAETPEVLQRLREIGVDRAQGYAVHEPCPLEELVRREARPYPIVA
jgi:diguanylate cyclase (GGDEF)-like protein/PAS domain S-box-containing protein